MTKDASVGTLAMLVLFGGLLYALSVFPPATINQDRVAVRAFAQDFGTRFKNVSLLATDAKEQIAREYAAYASPELIIAWQKNITAAPGRLTSSPWPDHLDVTAVNPAGERTYRVEGNVIELTSASSGPAASYLVSFVVRKSGTGWLVTEYQRGSYR
jgi:hypothetical protein